MPTPDIRPPQRPARGAGGPLVLVLVTGIVIGFLVHQPIIGFLVGLGLGLVIAILLWFWDRG